MNLEEYRGKKSKSKIISRIIFVSGVLGILAGFISDGTTVKDFVFETFFPERVLYKNINNLNTGVQISYFDELLGKPVIVRNWEEESFPDYKEYIYAHDNFFVKSITDESSEVLYYAVTTRNVEKFNPDLPSIFGENLKLGKVTYSEINVETPQYPNYYSLYQAPRFCYYHESRYIADGLYNTVLVGGYLPVESNVNVPDIVNEEDEKNKNKKLATLRRDTVPDTYAIISGAIQFDEEIMVNETFGVEYGDKIKFKSN